MKINERDYIIYFLNGYETEIVSTIFNIRESEVLVDICMLVLARSSKNYGLVMFYEFMAYYVVV